MGLFDKDSFNKALKRATYMAMMDEDEREAFIIRSYDLACKILRIRKH